MMNPLTLLLIAAALLVSTAGPGVEARLGGERDAPETRPRDGPAWLARFKPTPEVDALAMAADVELYAACLRAGLSNQAACTAVAEASGTPERWRLIASLLSVGVSAERAWAEARGVRGLEDLGSLVVMSGRSGAAVASGCGRIVDTLRADAAAQATATAERAGVLIALPLALCFLPAFIVLGLAPVVVSLGSAMF